MAGSREVGVVTTRRGAVSTPQHLVDFIVEEALRACEPRSEGLRVLEPACGDAVFLRTVAESLGPRGVREGVGVDIDEAACVTARRLLFAGAGRQEGEPRPSNPVEILAADFLLSDAATAGLESSSFDLILGNPPYVSTGAISPGDKEALRARYRTAYGRLELYTLFMERSIELLAPGGVLAFVVPDKFLTSLSARRLRDFISEDCVVESIARFSSHRVFPDADTVPCVVVLKRGAASGPDVRVDHCEVDDQGARPVIVRRRTSLVPRRHLSGDRPMSPSNRDVVEVIERMMDRGMRLGDETSRISAGLATGLNAVYVRDANLLDEDIAPYLRPAVRGRDIRPFEVRPNNVSILVPYDVCDEGTPLLAELSPGDPLWGYLSEFREQLENRHCVRVWGKVWYDLHDPVHRDLLVGEKVVVPDVAAGSRFAVCPPRHVPLNSAYYVVPEHLPADVLAAVLNSTPLAFCMRVTAPQVKDGFRRHRKQFLQELPLPSLSDGDVQAVRDLVATAGHDEIDELVWNRLGFLRPPRIAQAVGGGSDEGAVARAG